MAPSLKAEVKTRKTTKNSVFHEIKRCKNEKLCLP